MYTTGLQLYLLKGYSITEEIIAILPYKLQYQIQLNGSSKMHPRMHFPLSHQYHLLPLLPILCSRERTTTSFLYIVKAFKQSFTFYYILPFSASKFAKTNIQFLKNEFKDVHIKKIKTTKSPRDLKNVTRMAQSDPLLVQKCY